MGMMLSKKEGIPFPCSGVTLSDLVEEIQIQFFCYLDIAELHSCRSVCQLWRNLIDQPTLWRLKCELNGYVVTSGGSVNYKKIVYRNVFGRINLLKNWNAEGIKFKNKNTVFLHTLYWCSCCV